MAADGQLDRSICLCEPKKTEQGKSELYISLQAKFGEKQLHLLFLIDLPAELFSPVLF